MIKLELSEQMVTTIGQSLGQLPYNVAAPVIAELQRQINEQKKGIPTVEEMREEVKEAA